MLCAETPVPRVLSVNHTGARCLDSSECKSTLGTVGPSECGQGPSRCEVLAIAGSMFLFYVLQTTGSFYFTVVRYIGR